MAVSISNPPLFKNLISIAAAQATGASAAFTIPFADAYTFYLNVTTAGQTSMDTVFQTSVDGGTTFVNVPWRFAQVTTTTGCFVLDVHAGSGASAGITGAISAGEGGLTAATGGVLDLPCIVDPRNMKLFMTVSGTAPISTLYVAAWSRGTHDTAES
jgi:hypothetical protein